MQNNITIKEITPLTVRTIVLLDGRRITVPIYKKFNINNHDGISFLFHLNIFNNNNILHRSLANLVIDMLSIHSITYTATTSRALKKWFETEVHLATSLGLECIDSLNEVNANYQPFLIPLLRKLSKNFKDLISNDLADFLENSQKWEERKPAYFKLIANDPEKGAFTSQELDNIHSNLNYSFSNATLNLFDYTLAYFVIATGIRPVQISRLKIKDLQIINNNVMLKIPLAKGEGIIEQGYFLRKAPTILADCLIKYLKTVQNSDKNSSLFELNPNEVSKKIQSIFNQLDTYSSRLESKIPVNAYRFRYTLATRALASGASDQEVARLLTHRSLSCIRYYRASMPELQKPIQDALNEEMNFFAKAFKGKLIPSLDDAKFQNSAIADFFRLAGKNIGSCGTQAKCYQNAPIACLTCPYFEPLIDAPWDKLLQYLIEDQAKEQSLRIKEISIQAIKAVKDIINLIESRGD